MLCCGVCVRVYALYASYDAFGSGVVESVFGCKWQYYANITSQTTASIRPRSLSLSFSHRHPQSNGVLSKFENMENIAPYLKCVDMITCKSRTQSWAKLPNAPYILYTVTAQLYQLCFKCFFTCFAIFFPLTHSQI